MRFDMDDARAIALGVLKGLVIAVPLLVAVVLLGGCDPQKADAAQKRRYEVESIGWTSHPYMNVVTDTETGQRWLVVAESTGGVEIEPMDGSDR